MTVEKRCADVYSSFSALQDGRLRQAQLKMLGMLEVVDVICLKHGLDYWLEGGTLLGSVLYNGFIPWDDDIDIAMSRESYEAFLKLAPLEIPETMCLQTPHLDPGYFNLVNPLKIRDKHSRFIEVHEQGNEPYQQGIFVDVVVYDNQANNAGIRFLHKLLAKKLLRLLSHKYSTVLMGNHAKLYKFLSRFIPKDRLATTLTNLIKKINNQPSDYLGYGYDCINSSCIAKADIYPLKRAIFEGKEFNIPNQTKIILKKQYGDYNTRILPERDRILKHCRELLPNTQIPLEANLK